MTQERADKFFSFFEDRDFPPLPFEIGGMKILNLEKMVHSHYWIARNNWKNRVYLPYVLRLNEVKKAIEDYEVQAK